MSRTNSRLRSWAWLVVRTAVTAALLLYVLSKIDWLDSAIVPDETQRVYGWEQVVDGRRALVLGDKTVAVPPAPADPAVPDPVSRGFLHLVWGVNKKLLLLAIFALPVTGLVLALRWQWLLQTHNLDPGFGEAVRLSWVGLAANNVLPSSVGGDAVKCLCIGRRSPGKRVQAVMTVLMDRALGLVALLAVGGIALATQAVRPELAVLRQTMLAALAVILGGAFLFFSGRFRALLRINELLARLPLGGVLQKIDGAIFHYRKYPGVMAKSILLSLCLHLWSIGCIYLLGLALGMKAQPIYYYMFLPIIFTMGAFVPSIGGLGVLEGGFAWLFSLPFVGDTASRAVALSLLYRVVQIIISLPGLVWFQREIAAGRGVSAPSGESSLTAVDAESLRVAASLN